MPPITTALILLTTVTPLWLSQGQSAESHPNGLSLCFDRSDDLIEDAAVSCKYKLRKLHERVTEAIHSTGKVRVSLERLQDARLQELIADN